MTTLLLDSEWQDAFKKLPLHARAKMRDFAGRYSTRMRFLNPADFAGTPEPPETPEQRQQRQQQEYFDAVRAKKEQK